VILGVDIGVDIGKRRLAIGCVDCAGSAFSDSIDLVKAGDRNIELVTLADWLCQSIFNHLFLSPRQVRLWVETPFMSNGPAANQTTTIAMAEVVGAIQGAARWEQVTMVGQSTWKAKVCGNGRFDKGQVEAWLAYHHPDLLELCEGNQDRMDAMCAGLYGMMRSDGTIGPPEPRKKKKPKMRGQNPKLVIVDEVAQFGG